MTRGTAGILLFVLIGPLFASCSSAPSGNAIQQVVSAYFESRGYRVVALELGDVAPLSLGEKTYMGTEAYTVAVRKIDLQALEEVGPPWNHRKGQLISARNAQITIRKSTAQAAGWIVGSIAGIPVR